MLNHFSVEYHDGENNGYNIFIGKTIRNDLHTYSFHYQVCVGNDHPH